MLKKTATLLLLGLLTLPAGAAELWYVQHDQPLLLEPRHGADVIATLTSLSRVEWLERKGGYVRVNSGKDQGWIRIFCLRSGINKGGNFLGEIGGIANTTLRKTDATRIVASVGVRGVMEEALRSNNVRIDEVIKLEMLAHRSRDLPAEKLWKHVETFEVEHLPEQADTSRESSYE